MCFESVMRDFGRHRADAECRCFAHAGSISVNEATGCAFTHESWDTMTADEYEKLPAVDRRGFMECPECGEILSLEELLLHLAHKHSGSERLE
jgi:hypothetical protein